ncbi:MAG: hypothetical protein ABIR58_01810, partial [Gemmatimonadaceae bacterium]
MKKTLKSLDRYARVAAHIAIQKAPPGVQALFKHTDEYRTREMARLYNRARFNGDGTKGTILFWVPGGMPLLLHVEAALAAALRLRGYNVHAVICNSPYRACAIRTVQADVPIDRWRDVCATCIGKTSTVLRTMGIPFSYNGDFLTAADRDSLWERA